MRQLLLPLTMLIASAGNLKYFAASPDQASAPSEKNFNISVAGSGNGSITPLGYVNIQDIGCKPNDPDIDNAAIINSYINKNVQVSGSLNLYVPQGNWHCKTTIKIFDRTISIMGAGVTQTSFLFAPGVNGIWVNRTQKEASMGKGILERFSIAAKGKNPIIAGQKDFDEKGVERPWSNQGMKIWQRYSVRDVSIYGFSNRGLELYGDIRDKHDASFCDFNNILIGGCGGDGVFVVGPDSNASSFNSMDIRDCGGIGINDNSFLGNKWEGVMMHACAKGSMNVQYTTAGSSFIGCYTEMGQPPATFHKGVTVVGQNMLFAGITWR
jgi:hypothetical protein